MDWLRKHQPWQLPEDPDADDPRRPGRCSPRSGPTPGHDRPPGLRQVPQEADRRPERAAPAALPVRLQSDVGSTLQYKINFRQDRRGDGLRGRLGGSRSYRASGRGTPAFRFTAVGGMIGYAWTDRDSVLEGRSPCRTRSIREEVPSYRLLSPVGRSPHDRAWPRRLVAAASGGRRSIADRCKGESVWDRFATLPGKIKGVRPTRASRCDHYHRYEADADLIRDLGLAVITGSRSPGPGSSPMATGSINDRGPRLLRPIDRRPAGPGSQALG